MRKQTIQLITKIIELEQQSFRPFDIARTLSISPQYVHKLKKQYPEKFKDLRQSKAQESENPRERAKARLDELTPEAVETLGNVMRNPKSGAREQRQAAKDVLDQAAIKDQSGDAEATKKSLTIMRDTLTQIYVDKLEISTGKEECVDIKPKEE